MRKSLASVLLGVSLLSPACQSRDAARQPAPEAVPERVISQATGSSTSPASLGEAALPNGSAGLPTAIAKADPSTPPETRTDASADKPVEAPKAPDTSADLQEAKKLSRPVSPKPSAVAATGHAYRAKSSVAQGYLGGDATGSEAYHDWGKNAWTDAKVDHLSTFAADVDTASYTIARRKLMSGVLPPKPSVRVEEFVNYFRYALPAPAKDSPFGVAMDAAPSPLSPGRYIMRVAVATKPLAQAERKPAHLVFLVDVSGSMSSPDKLPLARQSLRLLVNNLKDGDTVSLVTYAGSSRVVLPPTGLDRKDAILAAIEELSSGGSTAMGSGIDLAYQQAMKGLTPNTVSRVIVCSDGDANVGAHSHDDILKLIIGRAKEGVTLSTLGFGMGNYKDELMEQLADKGNGNNFYIDSLSAAKRVFQDQLGSTLEVVAKDVKLQVDFDPALVARYRLVGYENRDVRDSDFRNDKVDAGEVGAGHQVTAIYEVELTDRGKQANLPLGGVRIRHKQPRGEKATEAAFPMASPVAASFANASQDLRFAFAVAAFADVLRGGQDAEHWSLAQIRDLARAAAGDDADRKQLIALIDRAIAIPTRAASR